MNRKEAEEHFDRGIHFFRGGFFPSALQEFRAVEKLVPDYPNIQYLIAATQKKSEEISGKLVSSLEESFDPDIIKLSESLEIEGTTDLTPQVEKLLRDGRYQEVLEKIEKAGTLVPESRSLLLLTAKVFRRLGRIKDSEKILRRALVLFPVDPEILNSLGNIYLAQNFFKDARDAFHQAISLNPENVVFQNNLGALEMQSYHLDAARRIFESIVKTRPSWLLAKRNLDNINKLIATLDEEIDNLRKEYHMHPSYNDISLSLGRALLFRGFTSEGQNLLEKVIKEKSGMVSAYYYLGTLHEMEGDVNKAIHFFREMVSRKKKQISSEFRNFESLFREGYHEEALAELKKIAVLDLDLAASNIHLGIRYFEEGNWKKALIYFEQAVTTNSTYPDAFYWKAMAKIQTGKKIDAVKDLQDAIALNPKYADAHYQLGMILRKKSPKKAKIHFQQAIECGVRQQFANMARDFLKEGQE